VLAHAPPLCRLSSSLLQHQQGIKAGWDDAGNGNTAPTDAVGHVTDVPTAEAAEQVKAALRRYLLSIANVEDSTQSVPGAGSKHSLEGSQNGSSGSNGKGADASQPGPASSAAAKLKPDTDVVEVQRQWAKLERSLNMVRGGELCWLPARLTARCLSALVPSLAY